MKEREEYAKEILDLTKKASEYQNSLEKERKEIVNKKKGLEKNKKVNKESPEEKKDVEEKFEVERKIFESEIKKLTSKLSGLSTNIMKEQRSKSEL